MKTLSFADLKVGRPSGPTLLTPGDAPIDKCFTAGLNLIVAPNGFGKTTLLQTLAGVLPPQAGALFLDGKKLNPEKDVVYVSEYLQFPKFIRAREWIAFVSGRTINGDHSNDELRMAAESFLLASKMNIFLGRMSQGERRKTTWLAAHHSLKPVVLMDEPLDGLDLHAIRGARDILGQWKAQGRIICVVAHQVGELLDLSDQVFLISGQKLRNWLSLYERPANRFAVPEFRDTVLEFYS